MPSRTPSYMSSLWANSCRTTSRPSRNCWASRLAARHDTMSGPSPWCVSPSIQWSSPVTVPLTGPGAAAVLGHRPGPHDDGADAVVPRLVESEDEQRGVGRDDGAHLVGQLELARRFPTLLAKQPVGELTQAVALVGSEQAPLSGALLEDLAPAVRKSLARGTPPAEHHAGRFNRRDGSGTISPMRRRRFVIRVPGDPRRGVRYSGALRYSGGRRSTP